MIQLVKFCDEQTEQAESQFQLLDMHMQMKQNCKGGIASYREGSLDTTDVRGV